MMKILFLVIAASIFAQASKAQNVGVSVSYFLPRNGYFSTPISPLSIRGIGFNFTKFLGIQTGATLYRMSGLNMTGLPFDSKEPFVGPNFTFYVPAEIVLQLKGPRIQFNIKAGGFIFYGVDQKLNYGNIDRAVLRYLKWDLANTTLTYQNNLGIGKHFGAELTLYVTEKIGLSLEGNYLIGSSDMPLRGYAVGGTNGGILQKQSIDYQNSKIDFTGLEISMGLTFRNGSSAQSTSRKRR